MKAVVVYESLWGNTAAVARAVAEGLGPDVPALSTAEATAEALAGCDLVVAGAPLIQFRLPTETTRAQIARDYPKAPPIDSTHPPMRTWLASLPAGTGGFAAFETRFWWSPGSSSRAISRAFVGAGYHRAAQRKKFLVAGKYGPLRAGELERARAWGAELARGMG